jgi:hypothetical protein
MASRAITKSHPSAVEAFYKEVGGDSVEDDPSNEGGNYSDNVSDVIEASEEDDNGDTSLASNEDNNKDNKSDASMMNLMMKNISRMQKGMLLTIKKQTMHWIVIGRKQCIGGKQ